MLLRTRTVVHVRHSSIHRQPPVGILLYCCLRTVCAGDGELSEYNRDRKRLPCRQDGARVQPLARLPLLDVCDIGRVLAAVDTAAAAAGGGKGEPAAAAASSARRPREGRRHGAAGCPRRRAPEAASTVETG